MKLEFKHLVPYLPYGLKWHLPFDASNDRFESMLEGHPFKLCAFFFEEEVCKEELKEYYSIILTQENPFISYEDGHLFLGNMKSNLGFEEDDVFVSEVKPILRPLSYLTEEIEHNGEKFVPIDYFLGEDYDLVYNACLIHNDFSYLPYNLVQLLLEWHFDLFKLTEQGLAIDINTLN